MLDHSNHAGNCSVLFPGLFPVAAMNGRGFSLVELLVVLALLALLSALAPPMIAGAVDGARLNGAARQLVAGLRGAWACLVTPSSAWWWRTGNGYPTTRGLSASTRTAARAAGASACATAPVPPLSASTG